VSSPSPAVARFRGLGLRLWGRAPAGLGRLPPVLVCDEFLPCDSWNCSLGDLTLRPLVLQKQARRQPACIRGTLIERLNVSDFLTGDYAKRSHAPCQSIKAGTAQA